MEHTPTPWGWYAEDASMAILCGKGGAEPIEAHVLAVSPCQSCQPENNKEQWTWGRCSCPSAADAAFIVRACNSHKALVKALQGAEEWLSGWQSAEPYLSTIRAALKLAKEP